MTAALATPWQTTDDMQRELARQARRAEVATGVLHDVGNALTSVNVALSMLLDAASDSRLAQLARAVELLNEHTGDIGSFLSDDPRGRRLLPYLGKVTARLQEEHQALSRELEEMRRPLDHIRTIIGIQQAQASSHSRLARCDLQAVVDNALRLDALSLERNAIEVVHEGTPACGVLTDEHKVVQILVNLLSNARKSVLASGRSDGRVTIRHGITPTGDHLIDVSDNGVGIAAEHLCRVFVFGFTTNGQGHGFGLHNSANLATELGGSLRVASAGPGQGATFTLEIPAPNAARAAVR